MPGWAALLGPGGLLRPDSLCSELSAITESSLACWQTEIPQLSPDDNKAAFLLNLLLVVFLAPGVSGDKSLALGFWGKKKIHHKPIPWFCLISEDS